MAMFTAYFDASGKPDRPNVMFVSGFVSKVGTWKKFDRAWLAMLDRWGLENPFHMTEFKMATGPHYKGERYGGWTGRNADQRAFELEAIRLIDQHVHKEFTQGLVVEDFDRMHREFEIPPTHPWASLINKPLAHCGLSAMLSFHEWQERYRKRKKYHGVEIIFDRGDTHRAELAAAIRHVFNVDIIPRDKKDHPGLQAADMLAWYHARSTGDITYGKPFHLAEQMEVLMRWMNNTESWGYGNWKQLERYCIDQGFKRKGQP